MNKRFIHLAFLIAIASMASNAKEHAPDIDAINLIGKDLTDWWGDLPKTKPVSISILSVKADDDITTDFTSIAEDVLLAAFSRAKDTSAKPCFECRRPRIVVHNDRLIVTKGVPNHDVLRALAKELELDSFATVYVSKTPLSLQVLVTVHSAPDGQVFASRIFEVQNFVLYDASMQFLLSAGLQWDLSFTRTMPSNPPVPLAIEFSWLQRIGRHTRVGLSGGGIFMGHSGNLGFVTPKIGWKVQFGRSAFAFAPSVQTGFGFRFPSTIEGVIPQPFTFGLVSGLALDFTMGHFFYMGAKLDAYLPFSHNNIQDFTYYPGFHIGMAIGR